MLLDKLESFLLGGLPLDQFTDGPEPVGSVGLGDLARLLDVLVGMAVRQAEQALKDAHPLNAPGPYHRFGPLLCVRSDPVGLVQQPGGAAFDAGDLLTGNVR